VDADVEFVAQLAGLNYSTSMSCWGQQLANWSSHR
jgi:hypothetical protein